MTPRLAEGMQAPDFTFDTPWAQRLGFHAAIDGTTAVVFFLRYLGCPLCQSTIAEIRRDIEKFRAKGAAVFVVLQSDPVVVQQATDGDGLPFTVICDPEQAIFRLYGVEPGNILHYLAPSVVLRAMRASRGGFARGLKEGHEFQRPAVFIVDHHKTVAFAHFGGNIGDVPDNAVILARLKGVRKAGR